MGQRFVRTWQIENGRGERNYLRNPLFKSWVPAQSVYFGRWAQDWDTSILNDTQNISVSDLQDVNGVAPTQVIPVGSVLVPADTIDGPIHQLLAAAIPSGGNATFNISPPTPLYRVDDPPSGFTRRFNFSTGFPFTLYTQPAQPDDWELTNLGGEGSQVDLPKATPPAQFRDLSAFGNLSAVINGDQNILTGSDSALSLHTVEASEGVLAVGELIQPGDLVFFPDSSSYLHVAGPTTVAGDGTVRILLRSWFANYFDGVEVLIIRPRSPEVPRGSAVVCPPRHAEFVGIDSFGGNVPDNVTGIGIRTNDFIPSGMEQDGIRVWHDPAIENVNVEVGATFVAGGSEDLQWTFEDADQDFIRQRPGARPGFGSSDAVFSNTGRGRMLKPWVRLQLLNSGIDHFIPWDLSPMHGGEVRDEIIRGSVSTSEDDNTQVIISAPLIMTGFIPFLGSTTGQGVEFTGTLNIYGTAPLMIVRWITVYVGNDFVGAPFEHSLANQLWQRGNHGLKSSVLGDRFIRLRIRDVATEPGFVTEDELLVLGARVRIIVPGLIDPPGILVRIIEIKFDLIDIGNTEIVVDTRPPKLLPVVRSRV